jgi:hypothetical protein
LLHHVAALVDECRNTRIGRLANPAARFNSAQFGIIQVLIFAGGVFPPAVVGNNGDKLCAFFNRTGYPIAPKRFIANRRRNANAALRIKYAWFFLPA